MWALRRLRYARPHGASARDLDNLSGLAASWRNPGVLFAHNDMTQAHVFALATDGHVLARFAPAMPAPWT